MTEDYIKEIKRLRKALEDIAQPLVMLKQEAEINGYKFNNSTANLIITVNYLRDKAEKALREKII